MKILDWKTVMDLKPCLGTKEKYQNDFPLESSFSLQDVVKKLLKTENFYATNWLIARLMSRKQKIRYAIFSAKEVIDIFEKKYPNDKRPRKAIEVAEEYLKNPLIENKKIVVFSAVSDAVEAAAVAATAYSVAEAAAAEAAAEVAYAVALADAADAAADAATDAVYAVAFSSEVAVSADAAAISASDDAVVAAGDAICVFTNKKIKQKIIDYGIELLEEA